MSRMDPEDARQGQKGTPVLRILIAALALLVIIGAGLALYPWPQESVPDASTGGGLGAPPSPNTATTQGNSTVAPQANGPSGSGNAPN